VCVCVCGGGTYMEYSTNFNEICYQRYVIQTTATKWTLIIFDTEKSVEHSKRWFIVTQGN
jgi:hypothetical protein